MKGKFYIDREIELLLLPVHPASKEDKSQARNISIFIINQFSLPSRLPVLLPHP